MQVEVEEERIHHIRCKMSEGSMFIHVSGYIACSGELLETRGVGGLGESVPVSEIRA